MSETGDEILFDTLTATPLAIKTEPAPSDHISPTESKAAVSHQSTLNADDVVDNDPTTPLEDPPTVHSTLWMRTILQ